MQWHMPIGYKVVNGKITVYEKHWKRFFMIMTTGISTLRIAEDLKARGICNAHDRVAWTHASIGKSLKTTTTLQQSFIRR